MSILPRVSLVTAAAMLFTMLLAFAWNEPIYPFYISILISGLIGSLIQFTNKKKPIEFTGTKDAYLIVAFAWIYMSLIGSLPYIFSGHFSSNLDSVFESVSGFTTTGSSILTDIEILPRSILFWRSMTHWIGGIGIIVLVIIILPQLSINNYNLFTLESSVREKIHPRIRNVGYRLLIIYLLLTITQITLLMLGGMNLFESSCHAMGTVSTGGFSPKNTSIADYSAYIQYVIGIFMILGGTNFVVHYYILHRQWKEIKNNDEFWFYLKFFCLTVILLWMILISYGGMETEKAFRDAFFQVASILTCTGFATADYLLWPRPAIVIIFFLLFVGGSTGSTAGGIKIARHMIALKSLKQLMIKLMHPNYVINLKINHKKITDQQINSIYVFIFTYLLIGTAGTLTQIAIGLDFATAVSSIATAMGGIGPGIGSIGPAANFAHLPELSKLVSIVFMLLGRLELYAFIIVLTPSFWKN